MMEKRGKETRFREIGKGNESIAIERQFFVACPFRAYTLKMVRDKIINNCPFPVPVSIRRFEAWHMLYV